ncbi:ABC transporter ATP-binding protein [Alkalibacter saccharofermentans]|uniref:Putative ABC transport system ATP-binding protein n=1 Tax=Alkalibacter saccharofermentans DSM 14828 TaxID=1120975 RepID=A0A1M4Y201_9FIRM|nr:ABC transporter ATP-binding protein [Alkalibacter saccharofermentans]SHE99596.1 putative ABC transport system ATP-binding protein [Alkalibacter saccharofermentans DSM 14828]
MSIILKNVMKTYKSGEVETHALKGVSLEIKEGEFIVILGPSGSGKSTLLNVISGLDTPTSGVIMYKDTELTKLSEDKLTEFRRNHLGFVFQQYNLLQNLTALENVQMGSDIGKAPLDPEDILAKVGLKDQMHKYPYQLSGGEQQRVSVARSVAKNPEILFCDEPTGSLDEETSKQVLRVIEDLNRDLKTTMVVITHNPGIGAMADRVIKMNSGKIEEIIENKDKISAGQIQWG